jgi:hypothetical protein
MGEKTISTTLPLDSDGFLRRECPSCKRQFKWRPSQAQTTNASEGDLEFPARLDQEPDENHTPEFYYCPYCAEPAAPGAWWTKEQIEYGTALVKAEILGPHLRDLAHSLHGLDRPGGIISVRVNMNMPDITRPEPLMEPDDMVRVDYPCHPGEPLKVEESWAGEVSCLVCGIRYPVQLVRELPEIH